MIINPYQIIKIVCPREFWTILKESVPSVSERTLRGILNENNIPRQKTIDLIFQDLQKAFQIEQNNDLAISSTTMTPWKAFLSKFKKYSGDYFSRSMDYAFDVIVSIEELYNNKFIINKSTSYTDLNLAKSAIEYLENYRIRIKNNQNLNQEKISAQLQLAIVLYSLSSLEISLINSNDNYVKKSIWIHKLLPTQTKEQVISPMKTYFRIIYQTLGFNSAAQFSKTVPSILNKTVILDEESQRRQLHRWMAGKQFPSWKTMKAIYNINNRSEESVYIEFGVARFLQLLFDHFNRHSKLDINEIILSFQEYKLWQKYHQKAFKEWRSHGGQA